MHRDSFFRFYANLPVGIRREVVLDMEDVGPITWDIAYKEVKADSDLGKKILQKLVELKFVHVE